MSAGSLSRRQLNRATLARQLLLGRDRRTTVEAVEQVAGLQSQEPGPPYLGLWARLSGFGRDDLHMALHDRSVVRATSMRGTLHTVSRADYLAWRPILEPLLVGGLKLLGERAAGLDREATVAAARRHLAAGPLTFTELRQLLMADFPEVNDRALGYATRMLLPLVIVPTLDRWSFARDPSFTPAETWLDSTCGTDSAPQPLIRRYLAAFGPATLADFQSWSGLGRMKAAFDGLDLVTYTDEKGRRLYDLRDAALPDPDTPAPVVFLPDFDNLLLAHDDRSRVIAEEHRGLVVTKNLRVNKTFLVDGVVAGLWRLSRTRKVATLELAPFVSLPRRVVKDLSTEGERLIGFVEPDAAAVEIR
jgi:hypothetical protein